MRVNTNKLKKFCNAKISDFYKLGQVVESDMGKYKRRYTYIDRGSNVLAVAHLDTVLGKRDFSVVRVSNGDEIAFSTELDDRLGVYAILSYLPAMGAHFDVLLTENEEIADSTANLFVPSKTYNWIVEFDRRGDGVVLYQYDDIETRKLMQEYGVSVETGTFSDISVLDDLGCKGFNFGVGYYNEHTPYCHMFCSTFELQMNKFMRFYRDYKNVHLPHTKQDKFTYSTRYDSSENDLDYGELYGTRTHSRPVDDVFCEECGRKVKYITDEFIHTGLCKTCLYGDI